MYLRSLSTSTQSLSLATTRSLCGPKILPPAECRPSSHSLVSGRRFHLYYYLSASLISVDQIVQDGHTVTFSGRPIHGNGQCPCTRWKRSPSSVSRIRATYSATDNYNNPRRGPGLRRPAYSSATSAADLSTRSPAGSVDVFYACTSV